MRPPAIDTAKLMTKEGALLELLATHFSVLVYLDSRRIGVVVPRRLRQAVLVLKLGLNFGNQVRDLVVEDAGWSATLLIHNELARVYVPWSAVFGIYGDTGIGKDWPRDIPKDAPQGALPQRAADIPPRGSLRVPPPVLPEGRLPPLPPGHPPLKPQEKRRTLPPWMRIIEGGKSKSARREGPFGPNPPVKAS